MSYLLSTTGTSVVLSDIMDQNNSGISFSHPTVDFDILTIGDTEMLRASSELIAKVASGDLTLTYRGKIIEATEIPFIGIGPDSAGYPEPYITSVSPPTINHSVTVNLTITGGIFTPNASVVIPGVAVNSVTYVSTTTIIVNVTSGVVDQFHDVTITDIGGSDTLINGLQTLLLTWVDLRLGGDVLTDGNGAGNDIRYRAGMTMTRDVAGMSFSGATPWSSWVKLESLGWTRGDTKTVHWIFTQPTGAMMLGISSDATNENATDQYQQSETNVYFSNATNQWGLYGNNGTVGAAGNQAFGASIGANTYKVSFTDDGSAGGVYTLYQLPSANPIDWDDIATIISTFTIGGSLNPAQANIMPAIIPPSGGTQRFVAVKVE